MNIDDCIKEIPDRLKLIEEHFNLNKREMSERMGLSRSYYSTVATGQQSPSFDFLLRICIEFNISADWLLFGINRMFKTDNEFLSDLEQLYLEMIRNILKMSPVNRVKVLKVIDDVMDLIPDEEKKD